MDMLTNSLGKLRKNWKGALIGITIGGLALPYALESFKSHAPEDEEALDRIHKLSYVFKGRTVSECGSTNNGYVLAGFKNDDGIRKAYAAIKNLYKTPQEQAEILQFLADNNVRLHATSASPDDVHTVFYNNTKTGSKTLIVKAGIWNWTDYSESLKTLIERMKTGDLLQQDGTTLIFDNKFEKKKSFQDIRTLPGYEARSFPVIESAPTTTEAEVFTNRWKNPCADAPAIGK